MSETEVLEVPVKKTGSQTKKTELPLSNDNEQTQTNPSVYEPPKQKFSVPKQENRVFKLEGNKKQGTVTIMGVEDVTDPKTGNPRRMRWLRGANSIWMDEQQQFDKIKGYVEKNVLSLVIQKGTFSVDVHDKLKNMVVDLSNRNLDNPNRKGIMKEYYKEWNTAKQANEEMELEEMEFKAMGIAHTALIDDIVPHAHYLGVDFIDPISGHPLDEQGIRKQYVRKAKADPKKFMNSIHSPVVQMGYKIRRAIDGGKIDLGKQPGQAFWQDGGFISVVPQGRNAVEFLTEFAQMQNESSKQFVFQLGNIIP